MKQELKKVKADESRRKNGLSKVYQWYFDIEIEEITVDPIDIMISFKFLGSNLGLLSGMGLYQLLEGFLSLLILYKLYNLCITSATVDIVR